MAETAQTMTEFTYAPGEKNIVGDRFSPSVIIFWLKTSIAASSTPRNLSQSTVGFNNGIV